MYTTWDCDYFSITIFTSVPFQKTIASQDAFSKKLVPQDAMVMACFPDTSTNGQYHATGHYDRFGIIFVTSVPFKKEQLYLRIQ